MPDLTSQPAAGTGVNSRYSGAVFLFNGADTDKNCIGNVASTTGAKGTTGSSADGTYRLFNSTDGPMTWNVTLSMSAYTLVLIACYPTGSITPMTSIFTTNGGGGVRIETQTTGGGVYTGVINTGGGAPTNPDSPNGRFVDGVPGFDGRMWTYVYAYDGANIRQYRKTSATASTPSDVTQVASEAIGFASPSGSSVSLGATVVGHGVLAAMLVPSDVGDAECDIIVANGWAIFDSGSSSGIKRFPPQFSGGFNELTGGTA